MWVVGGSTLPINKVTDNPLLRVSDDNISSKMDRNDGRWTSLICVVVSDWPGRRCDDHSDTHRLTCWTCRDSWGRPAGRTDSRTPGVPPGPPRAAESRASAGAPSGRRWSSSSASSPALCREQAINRWGVELRPSENGQNSCREDSERNNWPRFSLVITAKTFRPIFK